VQGLALAAAVLAVMGAAGQALRFALIFANYPFGPMALHTAAGFIALSVALWLCARRTAWYRNRTLIEREDRRIAAAGAGIVTLIVCAYAIGAFAVTMRQLEEFARNNLLAQVNGRVELFRDTIEQRRARTAAVVSRQAIVARLGALHAGTAGATTLEALGEDAENALLYGLSGVAFYGCRARHVRQGRLAEHRRSSCRSTQHRSLLWDDGFALYDRITVRHGGEPVGVIVTEQRLDTLTRAFRTTDSFAASAEAVICRRLGPELDCVRQRPEPPAFQTGYAKTLPMAHALAGATGVVVARDYRDQIVIAAHAPIGATGLGMVIKLDTAELYAPVRRHLAATLALLALVAVLGAWLLRLRIAPLVRRLMSDEERLSLALDGSRLALWDFDVRSGRSISTSSGLRCSSEHRARSRPRRRRSRRSYIPRISLGCARTCRRCSKARRRITTSNIACASLRATGCGSAAAAGWWRATCAAARCGWPAPMPISSTASAWNWNSRTGPRTMRSPDFPTATCFTTVSSVRSHAAGATGRSWP
jgi:hypothetical protein